jgi:hypothetical protein
MPELMENAVIFGVLAAILSRFIPIRRSPPHRMPLWGSVLTGVVVAYSGPPVFAILQEAWRAIPFLPEITGGMVFIGFFVIVALQIFESKGQPRRIPIWAAMVVAAVVALAVPQLVYMVTGSYSHAALRSDVNRCTRGMLGEEQPGNVTNACDFPIVVGLCMPDETNPVPCQQTVTLAPGAVAGFDAGDVRLSFAPGNRDGLTVIACRPPNRPSRMLSQVGRRHEGVCLPGL